MSLIVLEGLDGSGKGTQLMILSENIEKMGVETTKIDYPDYESDSSALVKMYLNGEFGSDPKEVNPYASSMFYAVDRFSGYTKDWKKDYESGKTIVANRYSGSNIIYQMSKLQKEEWDEFIDWVIDTEHVKFSLPSPDRVIYLDMPTEISQKLMSSRYSGDESKKDIHEKNLAFLANCRECALFAAKKLDWTIIDCSNDGQPRKIEEISSEILENLKDLIGK